jgi:hypothetical protein
MKLLHHRNVIRGELRSCTLAFNARRCGKQRESPGRASVPGLSCLRYAYRIDPAMGGGQSGPEARLSGGSGKLPDQS